MTEEASKKKNTFWGKFIHAMSDEGWEEMWSDLNPWELCASAWQDEDGDSPPDIPKVVSICYSEIEKEEDDISDICENRHCSVKSSRRSVSSQTADTHPSTDSSEVFAVRKPSSKKKKIKRRIDRRDAPPLPRSPGRRVHSSSPMRRERRRSSRSLSKEPYIKQRAVLERRHSYQHSQDIPKKIIVRL